MALSDRQLLDSLNLMPFVESTELDLVLGEPHSTIQRRLTDLMSDGIAGRVSHGTAHLPSSRRYYLTARGIRQAAQVLDFDTPSDFVRAYPVSREWLTLLIRRMDAVASVYRLASSLSPGSDGLRSYVEFHRRGRFDATITLSAKAATPTITVYTVGTTKPCIWLGRSGEESEQGALDDGVPELVALYPCRSALSACFAAVLEDRKQRESGRTRRPMADCEGPIKGQKRPSQGAFLPARRGSYYRPRLASPSLCHSNCEVADIWRAGAPDVWGCPR